MSALKSIGAKNIHLENESGMSNQPEVVVFNGSKRQAEDALNEAGITDSPDFFYLEEVNHQWKLTPNQLATKSA